MASASKGTGASRVSWMRMYCAGSGSSAGSASPPRSSASQGERGAYRSSAARTVA